MRRWMVLLAAHQGFVLALTGLPQGAQSFVRDAQSLVGDGRSLVQDVQGRVREESGSRLAAPLWQGIEPGPYAVGFRVLFLRDSARSSETGGRAIRLFVWYPAMGGGAPMRFGDYTETAPTDESLTDYNALLHQRDRRNLGGQFRHPRADSLSSALLEVAVPVVADATPHPGGFPLVVHALGIGSHQLESTVLWEALASDGFVVGVVPQFGPDVEAPDVEYSADYAALQVSDVQFAVATLRREDFVDATRTALVGHSFGGLVSLVVASQDSLVRAVVQLDGSVTIPRGIEVLESSAWNLAKTRAAILNMYTHASGERSTRVLDTLEQLDRTHVVFENASHYDFQNWPLYATWANVTDPRGERRRPTEEGRDIFRTCVRLTRAFLGMAMAHETPPAESAISPRVLEDIVREAGVGTLRHQPPGKARPEAERPVQR